MFHRRKIPAFSETAIGIVNLTGRTLRKLRTSRLPHHKDASNESGRLKSARQTENFTKARLNGRKPLVENALRISKFSEVGERQDRDKLRARGHKPFFQKLLRKMPSRPISPVGDLRTTLTQHSLLSNVYRAAAKLASPGAFFSRRR